MQFTLTTLLALVPSVLSHGLIQSPPARSTGASIVQNCGTGVTNNIKADNTSHVEGLPELAAKDSAYKASSCNLWLCKGLQYADNTANVQKWVAGQVVPIKVWIRIPHEGSANVSIVDTKKNAVIGAFLKNWPSGYAPGTKESDVPKDQENFSVVIPDGLESKCATAGDCVLQWWWYGNGARQTYESCVDFTIVSNKTMEYTEKKFVA